MYLTAVRSEQNSWVEGRDLFELAREAGTTPGEIMCRLVRYDYGAQHVHTHPGGESGLGTIMQHENHIACSDAIYAGAKPHPRCYGAYARYLGVYVRERHVLTLEECIRHMTSSPATMMGFSDRGRLREGAKADIVVFDESTVSDRATIAEPRAIPSGIDYVVVNGVLVRENGTFTEATPGRGLRSGAQ
jgi:N-acyl-D-amino-acid deacylase